jgi:hypothetical protein
MIASGAVTGTTPLSETMGMMAFGERLATISFRGEMGMIPFPVELATTNSGDRLELMFFGEDPERISSMFLGTIKTP